MKASVHLAASLCVCVGTSLFAQAGSPVKKTESAPTQFCGGNGPLQGAPAAYNAPAGLCLDRDWNVFTTASWLFWYAEQDGLDLAVTMAENTTTNLLSPLASGSSTVLQNFSYKSGFKVGAGSTFGHEEWILRCDWTRLHQSTHQSASAPAATSGLVGALANTNWFYQVASTNQSLAASSLDAVWNLHLDWIDLTASRPFYQAMKLTVEPFVSVRAAVLRQSLLLTFHNVLNAASVSSSLASHNNSDSWAVGPRVGVAANCLLGKGVRLQARAGSSLLYTAYTTIAHSEDPTTLGGNHNAFSSPTINALRPIAEGSLGLGWNWCSAKKKWDVDLSATYDFNYLWAQNMMRAANDLSFIGSGSAPGDLTLQGLSVSGSVTF